MEDIRPYRAEDEQQPQRRIDDERRYELEKAITDEEVPFHIPRD